MIHKEMKSKASKVAKESKKRIGTAIANTLRSAIPVAVWLGGVSVLGPMISADRILEMLVALLFVAWTLAPIYILWRALSLRVPRIKREGSAMPRPEEAAKFRVIA